MNLNNTQIEALVRQMTRKEQEKLDKKNKKLKLDIDSIKKRLLAEYKGLSPEIKRFAQMYNLNALNQDTLSVDSYLRGVFQTKPSYVDTNLINEYRDKIIIASIDSVSMTELKEKLNLEL